MILGECRQDLDPVSSASALQDPNSAINRPYPQPCAVLRIRMDQHYVEVSYSVKKRFKFGLHITKFIPQNYYGIFG